eukprot:4407724-Pyramimonas_sp.AAC.1
MAPDDGRAALRKGSPRDDPALKRMRKALEEPPPAPSIRKRAPEPPPAAEAPAGKRMRARNTDVDFQ